VPLQIGVEFDFGSAVSVAVLGEGTLGFGYPFIFEVSLGGMAEVFFARKTIGAGIGLGSSTVALPWESLEDSKNDGKDLLDVTSTYLRLAFLLRRNSSKTTIYTNIYANGDWGFGVQFTLDLFD
jgi:hypothetical protein